MKPYFLLVCFFTACGQSNVQTGTATCNGKVPVYATLQHNGSGAAGSYTVTEAGTGRFPRAVYSLSGSVNTTMRAYVTLGSALCEYRPPSNGQAFLIHTCAPGTEVSLQAGDTVTMYRDGGGVLVETEVGIL